MSRDIKPLHSLTAINKAGERIRSGNYTSEDDLIIENWRASHNHILNSWQATLRNRCNKRTTVLAQRLKRKNTIYDKLQRQKSMSLSRMQDIAGCRLIFKNMKELEKYRESLHKSKLSHIRKKADVVPYPYDYIQNPAPSGYRGIHDIYEYKVKKGQKNYWDGLAVEIQYRTIYQHAWATAVEVAGMVTGNHSKFDRGDDKHKEFFKITSEIIARAYENKTSCKSDLSDSELTQAFLENIKETNLILTLTGIKSLSPDFTNGKDAILIFTDINLKPKVEVKTYKNLTEATKAYFDLEKQFPDANIVLVRADSQKIIKNAFRNYFADVEDFIKLVLDGVSLLLDREKEEIEKIIAEIEILKNKKKKVKD